MPYPNRMKSMIVIEYDMLPEIKINIDIPLTISFDDKWKKKKYIHSIMCFK